MTKTRSQTGKVAVKEEQDCKTNLLSNAVNNTSRKSTKTGKKPSSRRKKDRLAVQKIKLEKDTDTKSLLKPSPTLPNPSKRKAISKDQIDQLIDFIVNHNMGIGKASKKANLHATTGCYYYHMYKSNPEKKMPLPRNLPLVSSKYYTQEDVGRLIRYIVDDKMPIMQASAKANMSYQSALKYHAKYLQDPNHAIPKPRNSSPKCTQDQITKLIGYIVDDKMTIHATSTKMDMSYHTGTKLYQKYLNDPNHNIPAPYIPKKWTNAYIQEEINKFINYIVDDKMTMTATSKKANMPGACGSRYYRMYINDPNRKIPSPSGPTSSRLSSRLNK